MNFKEFSDKVESNFGSFKNVFEVDLEKEELWDYYLSLFPEGTNQIYQTRSYHDCTCCKHFVRTIGGLVEIKSDLSGYNTVWDNCEHLEYPYNEVAAKLAAYVREKSIVNVFATDQRSYGQKTSRARIDGIESVVTFDHFYSSVPGENVTGNYSRVQGDARTRADVLKRTLEKLSLDAANEVAELIDSNSIYRGAEYKKSVDAFCKMVKQYAKINSDWKKELFVWNNYSTSVSTFKNTSIGSLIEDLTNGRDLESAVASFESKVAPENYKRSKSLITPRMIESALKTVDELGYRESLERRMAKESDLSVNSVLFVDRKTAPLMQDSLMSSLMEESKPKGSFTFDRSKAPRIHVKDFVANILPNVSELDVFVENSKQNNLMTLTAPVHSDSKQIFKWKNDIGWSYNGNITDSIKDKVKRAGGNTDAKCRVSLSWFNTDDLDIHVIEPNGNHIYFGNKCGKLDVDMNVSNPVRDAVENVSWNRLMDGEYRVTVKNFFKRESTDVGYVLEFEIDKQVMTFSYNKPVVNSNTGFSFVIKSGKVVKVTPLNGVEQSGGISQDIWGVKTEQFVKVKMMLDSPNFWDDCEIGNKHWFFILDGCKTEEEPRGIYNEFLKDDLYQKHRKVFEVLGDKTKCKIADDQLSGYGVSSTKDDELVVRVSGEKTKTTAYRLYFN